MEALPTMPMIAPQFRTSTLSYDNIPNFDFRLKMKEYILLTFNADPHDYDAAFDELAQMKFEANIPAPSVEQICKLKRYYGQLCMMEKRFPMGSGGQLETPFAWHDGLVDMRSAQSEVTIYDIEFEKASVMFNIGTCHAQYAADQLRDTQDSIKTAFSHFQQAATAFEQLNTYRNSDLFYPSVDLDANVITFYYNVMVAQAQECIVQKSLLENRNPLVTAKLSLWLQEAYDATTRIVDEWSVNIPESVQRYYAKLCRLKSDIYGVIAYMAMGDHHEHEDKKKGWRLQYYNISNKFMEHLTQNYSKMKDRYPELYLTTTFLFDVISAKQKNAEKENDFIYHDRIPKQEEAIDAAKKEGSVCKVTVPKFNPLDPSVCGADLFEKLLPSFVQEANDKYTAKKDDIFKEMKEIIKSYDEHLNYQLQLAEFDKLRFMLNEGKNREAWFQIPEDLMQRNADMTAYPDCVPNLIEKMRESSDTARVAEAKLNTLLAKLRAIDLPRLKADEGFNLIQKELERLADHLEQAKANNVSLNKAIAQHSGNLQLLTLPCGEMWQKLIPVDEETGKSATDQSPEEQQVRKMVSKVQEMQKQRHDFLQEFATELKADDIATKLMGTNERGAEEIMSSEIQKHSTRQSAIRLNVTAQEAILRAFADANADFHGERSEMSKKKQEYEKKVNDLCASYEVYRDVARKCDEGQQFYRQLMARCDQFAIPVHAMEEQYREELEKKERAKQEAEHHMNQIRMSREAQSALMDFGGAPGPRSPAGGPMGPPGSMGPPGAQFAPPRAPGQRGPRLGDYLDSYRARKQTPQVQIPPEGPPSPTPSSVCDFPSSRSQRFGPNSPYPASQANPSPAYGGPGGPAPPQGPYGAPGAPSYGQYQPTPYQAPPPIQPGTPAYDQASSPYPSEKPNSYSVPRIVPGGQAPYGGSGAPQGYPGHGGAPQGAYGAPASQGYVPSPVQGAPGAAPQHFQGPAPIPPSHEYTPSPVPSQQGSQHQGYAGGGAYRASEPEYRPSPVQGGQGAFGAPQAYHSGHQTPVQGTQGPPVGAYGAQGPYGAAGGGHGGPGGGHGGSVDSGSRGPPQGYQGQPGPQPPVQGASYEAQGYPGHLAPVPLPPANQGPQGVHPGAYGGPQAYQGAPGLVSTSGNAPGGAQFQQSQGFGSQRPPTGAPTAYGTPNPHYNTPPTPVSMAQYTPSSVSAPQAASYGSVAQNQNFPGQGPAPVSQPIPPQQPSYQPVAPSGQPVYQHPPQGTPISAPPAQQNHQHVAPSPANKFQATPGAPSPWHATPAELKTPWNTTPQYHAPTPPTSTSGSVQPTHSNVDLLSDLLGDFNMAPSMQPTLQNTQHLHLSQQAPPSIPQPLQSQQSFQAPPPAPPASQSINAHQDFRVVHSNQPDPPKAIIRPAAAVQPMPQQPQVAPELSQIAQQAASSAMETPILIKGSPSVTELSDPTKFQLGEGNVQKLEKRMLHQSFRTNGPPPPLNQSDPLNQIDAFSFASMNRPQK